ncbi:MAG: Crp/Fnr family transcriptional regulator [Bacteroidia bacterium]
MDCTTCQNLALSSFCSLSKEELVNLNEYKQTNNVKKNQIIFQEDEIAKGLYCVHKGKVKLIKTFVDGNMQILRISKEAELIGYRGLLGNRRYIATGVAIEDSIVCFIPKDKIFELIAKNVKFTMEIMSKFAHDLSLAENKSVSFIQKNSRARLAETLLFLEKSFGKTNQNYINILLSREEIASIAGMATETAVRVLHEWEQNNMIELNKKHIGILEPEQLYKIAELEE